MTTPTPTALRAITLHLNGPDETPVGTFAARLVLTTPGQSTDPGAYAITHPIGSPAGGTHTEVVFVDDTAAELPDSLARELVRQVAVTVYGRGWAFDYAPKNVPDRVLRHGSQLRERVEVSEVELWGAR